jgi:hypothetical protein
MRRVPPPFGTGSPGSTTRGLAATPKCGPKFELEQWASKSDTSAHAMAGAKRLHAATEFVAALARRRISPTLHPDRGIKV